MGSVLELYIKIMKKNASKIQRHHETGTLLKTYRDMGKVQAHL